MKRKYALLLAVPVMALALVAGLLVLLGNAAPVQAAAVAQAATATPAAAAQPITVTVTGVVKNGTANASVPPDLQVMLHSFGASAAVTSDVTTLSTTVSAGGEYTFENVQSETGGQIVLSARYQDVLYTSGTATLDPAKPTIDIPLTIYETTAETASVQIEQMHLFLNFEAGQVTVGELYILSNSGDRTVFNPHGSVEFAVPSGVNDLTVPGQQEGTDYVRTAEGFAEAGALLPGSGTGQFLFTFSLPYTGQLSLEQKILYPAGAAGVMVPEVGVKLTSRQLQDQGVQNVQGTPYRIYGMGSLAPGGLISFELSGQPSASASTSAQPSTAAPGVGAGGLIAGLAALGVVLVGLGVWVYWRQARQGADEESLLQAIADLDDAFDNGEVEAEVYARRRARLKARLVEQMASDEPGKEEQAK